MRRPSILPLACAAALASAGVAEARTLNVDDDRAQCPAARYTTIQAAIADADRDDVVRVCAGDYEGPVVLPADRRLRLIAVERPPRTIIRAPEGGIVRPANRPLALVSIEHPGSFLEGFQLQGPVASADPEGDCNGFSRPSAVSALYGGTIRGNRMTSTVLLCPDGAVGAAIATGTGGGAFGDPEAPKTSGFYRIEFNEASHVRDGILATGFGFFGSVQSNSLTGLGTDAGRGVAFDRDSDDFRPDARSRITGNRISNFGTGIDTSTGGQPFVRGNFVYLNGTGIVVENGAHVQRNILRQNGDGIIVCPNAGCTDAGVDANGVYDSLRTGILVLANSEDLFIRNNVALRSAQLDCYDETALAPPSRPAYWSGNVGVDDVPEDLCREP